MPTTYLWYLSRGSGLVLLLVLTGNLVLGVLSAQGRRPFGWPRFVVQGLHRNLALLGVGLLVVHVASAELDPYTTLGWLAAAVPFLSPYQTLWMGLGTLSLDLFLLVLVTSLWRQNFGYRVWCLIHWLGYLSWPVALAHTLGLGPDTGTAWVFWTAMACTAAVVLSILDRLLLKSPIDPRAPLPMPPLVRARGDLGEAEPDALVSSLGQRQP